MRMFTELINIRRHYRSIVNGACILALWALSSWVFGSGPQMVMYQVQAADTWASVARHYQVSERTLRVRYNYARFMTALSMNDWIWVPNVEVLVRAQATDNTVATETLNSPRPVAANTLANTQYSPTRLPQLASAPANPTAKFDRLKLTLASAAKAAADDKLEVFITQQGASLADSTLALGSSRVSDLLWVNPEQWYWDYQLPLFDKEPLLNSRMGLPLFGDWQGELGIDYRDQRVTYQAGLNIDRKLGEHISGHLEPVLDYQANTEHQRGGVLLYLTHSNWVVGGGQYQPLSDWQYQEQREERAAAGQILFAEGRLGWLPGLSVSSEYYQWQGEQLNLQGSGDKHQAAQSRQWSINYSSWRILRLKSSVLSNSKDQFESKFQLGIELPLGGTSGQWWRRTPQTTDFQQLQPLQHHKVLVLEHK